MGRKRRSDHNLGVAAADEYGASDRWARRMKRRSIKNHDFKGICAHSEVKFDGTPKHNNAVNTTAQNGSGGVELVEESVDCVNSYNEKSSDIDNYFDEDFKYYLDHYVSVPSDDSDHSIDHVDNIANNINPVNQSTGNCVHHGDIDSDFDEDYKNYLDGLVTMENCVASSDMDGDFDEDYRNYLYGHFLDSGHSNRIDHADDIAANSNPINIVDDGQRENMMRPNEDAASATKHFGRCNELDSCYSTFLSLLKREGGDWVLRLESGEEVVYEEDERSSSDSEVIMMDTDPFAGENYTPFVSSKAQLYDITDEDDAGCLKSSSRNEHSKFRENLIKILKKPFDEEEYYLLWTEVQQRKPVKVEKDMRGGRTRSFLSEMNAPSYCDLHEDLDRSIEQAGCNKPKILNILRGFFYWLQNVAHDGVFKPWTDSSCLEVLPSVPRAAL